MRREGRLTEAQATALARLWPRYGIHAPTAPLEPGALFGRRAPLVFEIGFGNGDHLLGRAAREPQHDFIGAEVHRPGVGRLLLNAEKAGLDNLRVACHDAVEVLREALPDASLAEVVIYFPDPWHKKRHHKRRLIQPDFCALVARKLVRGGLLHLATDWAPYADQMLQVLGASADFENCAAGGGFGGRPATRAITRFEARGQRLGHEVFDLLFRRR